MPPDDERSVEESFEDFAEDINDSLVALVKGIRIAFVAVWGVLAARGAVSPDDLEAVVDALDQTLIDFEGNEPTRVFIVSIRDDLQDAVERLRSGGA